MPNPIVFFWRYLRVRVVVRQKPVFRGDLWVPGYWVYCRLGNRYWQDVVLAGEGDREHIREAGRRGRRWLASGEGR